MCHVSLRRGVLKGVVLVVPGAVQGKYGLGRFERGNVREGGMGGSGLAAQGNEFSGN